MIALAYAVPTGVIAGWSGVLDMVLTPAKVSQVGSKQTHKHRHTCIHKPARVNVILLANYVSPYICVDAASWLHPQRKPCARMQVMNFKTSSLHARLHVLKLWSKSIREMLRNSNIGVTRQQSTYHSILSIVPPHANTHTYSTLRHDTCISLQKMFENQPLV